MKILGLDFETTGLSTTESRIVEIGAALWDTDLGAPVAMFDLLVDASDGPPLIDTDGAWKTNGHSPEIIKRYGVKPRLALDTLSDLALQADWFMGHNAINFDSPILTSECARQSVYDISRAKPWLDTAMDVPYPEKMTCKKLAHLACEHGILNPFPHRALPDVMTMLKLMSLYPIDEIVKIAQSPSVRIRAVADYAKRELPKARKYRWDGEKKIWWKEIKEFDLERETTEAPFQVIVLERTPGRGVAYVPPFEKQAVVPPPGEDGGVPFSGDLAQRTPI